MEKSNCVVCGTAFSYRKGKQYCSDSCKTKAYDKRKNGVSISGFETKPKGSEVVFYMDEYVAVKKIFSSVQIAFDTYCFFRKNLPNNLPPESIAEIIEGYYESNRIDEIGNVNEDSGLINSFVEFQKGFFAGLYKIENTH